MANYEEATVKLTNNQLNKLKSAAKDKTGTTLRKTKKNFQELPNKLFLTTRQKTKIRNAFTNNMSTNIKLIKAQLSKIIQSVGFLSALSGELADPLMKVGVPLAKNLLAPLATINSASAIDGAIQRWCYAWKRCCKSMKSITLFISNEDMVDIIKIIKILENVRVLIDRVSEKVKHEKKTRKWISWCIVRNIKRFNTRKYVN